MECFADETFKEMEKKQNKNNIQKNLQQHEN